MRMHTKFRSENLTRRNNIEDPDIDRRIILKRTPKKQGVKVRNKFICLTVTNLRTFS